VDIQYLDVYDVMEEAQNLNITAVPTLVFYDGEGNVVDQNIGSMDKESLKARLDGLKGK
jgi:thioredoxin-related protein